MDSEKYLLSFLQKINEEFKNSLSNFSRHTNDLSSIECEEQDLDYLLQDEESSQQPQEIQKETPPSVVIQPKVFKTRAKTNLEATAPPIAKEAEMKKEKTFMSITNAYAAATSSENEQHLDEANMFDDKEIYDIMEIEGNEDIYVDEAGNAILNDDDEEGEFILVNYKSSNDDLSQEKHFLVEDDDEEEDGEDDDKKDLLHEPIEKRQRKKHVQRMPREIVDRYAQSTDCNQHICTKCVKVFSTRTNLIRHIQSHDGNKPYVCDICKKGFTQSGSLKQHMYIHSGERPYKCQFCDKAFTQGKTLKFHLRRHLDEKPFICSECNLNFRQRDGLKRHLKSRHNMELKFDRPSANEEKILVLVDEKESEKALEIIEEANDDESDKKMEF